jgi:hypothetical protein
VAASFGVEWLRRIELRRAGWLLMVVLIALVSSIVTLIGRRGGLRQVDLSTAPVYVGATFAISLSLLIALWVARSAPTDAKAGLIATGAAVGEASVYLPLGNDDLRILAARIALYVLVVLISILAARGVRVPASVTGVVAVGAYAGWQATLNGRSVDVIRVNGLVRGVMVPAAGRDELTVSHRPPSFVNGVLIGAASILFLLVLLGREMARGRRHLGRMLLGRFAPDLEMAPATR